MEYTINGVSCIKGEVSSIMTLMRWNEGVESSDGLIHSFRRLNEALEGVYDLREVECVTYIDPFHHVIVSKGTSGPLTSAALSSLSKFALYGFLNPHFPGVESGIAKVAECISNCIFEETDWESDEVIFMKMLELSALTLRCDASSLLTVRNAWEIYSTRPNIHHQYRASKILKSEAEARSGTSLCSRSVVLSGVAATAAAAIGIQHQQQTPSLLPGFRQRGQ